MDAYLVGRVDQGLEPGVLRLLVLGMEVVIPSSLQPMMSIQHIKAFQLPKYPDDAFIIADLPESVVTSVHRLPLTEGLVFLHSLQQNIFDVDSLVSETQDHGPHVILDKAIMVVAGPAECFLMDLYFSLFVVLNKFKVYLNTGLRHKSYHLLILENLAVDVEVLFGVLVEHARFDLDLSGDPVQVGLLKFGKGG